MTTYIRFPDEATAKSLLAQYVNDDGNWITASLEHALDPIGVISDPTPLEGWHLNLIGVLPEEASQYVVTPANPVRVFAA